MSPCFISYVIYVIVYFTGQITPAYCYVSERKSENKIMADNYNKDNKTRDNEAIKKQLEEEEREIEQAEEHQIRLEFSTNIIAAHKYCLRNVIHTGQGFDCEIIYLPRHKDPEEDRHFTKRFAVRLTSRKAIVECMEIRDGWGGYGEVWLGEQHIDHDRAQELIKHAMAIAATLINIPESESEQEKFFSELEAEAEEEGDEGEVVKQQEHNHELDLAIAELCADVELEFLEPKML
jgi:hypothetical protein